MPSWTLFVLPVGMLHMIGVQQPTSQIKYTHLSICFVVDLIFWWVIGRGGNYFAITIARYVT